MSRVLRVPFDGLQIGEQRLTPGTAHYLIKVLRLQLGEAFIAFDPQAASEAEARLSRVEQGAAWCKIEMLRPASRTSRLQVTLIHCLCKGAKAEQVVRAATALGAAHVVLAVSERSIARREAAGRAQRWLAITLDAARQSGRGDLPTVLGPKLLVEELGAWQAKDARKLMLEPGAQHSLHAHLQSWRAEQEELVMVVGPEGGFSSAEIEQAHRAGFVSVCAGPFTLRAELAAVIALGAAYVRSV